MTLAAASAATPAAAVRFASRHDDVELFAEPRDMFGTEEWGAVLSLPDPEGRRLYRYMLWRVFDAALPILLVVMLNPSVATHLDGDRTVDGLVRRARRLGYGGVLVVNCFAWRATDPTDMRRASDPVGPRNDDALREAFDLEVDLLCAWGTQSAHMGRGEKVEWAIDAGRSRPHCLRLCAGGEPEHPLYVPSDLGLSPWRPRSRDASPCAIR